jgi:hypothetical protein
MTLMRRVGAKDAQALAEIGDMHHGVSILRHTRCRFPVQYCGMSQGLRIAKLALLAGVSTVVALLLPELAYKAYVRLTERPSFRISAIAYSKFDETRGQRFQPNSKLSLAYIVEGKLVGCLDEMSSANSDGLGGRDTLADYQRADLKLISTGDSYSHWKQNKTTIADVVAETIRTKTGTSVANLNFARGAFGLVHMINIAAVEAEALRPDAVVIQFILDDLTRGWWYTREYIDAAGNRRALLAPTLADLNDPARSNDEYIVDPRGTYEWCRERLAKGGTDDVLEQGFERYRQLQREKRSFFRPELYESLIVRLTHREFFSVPGLPRIYTPQALRQDPRYAEGVKALRRSGLPILLVNLPVAYRRLSRDQSAILAAIEEDLGVKTIWLDNYVTQDKNFKWDMLPLEEHPSYEGIREYGSGVAAVVMERIKVPAAKQQR